MVRFKTPDRVIDAQFAAIDYTLRRELDPRFAAHWRSVYNGFFDPSILTGASAVELDIGAGSGLFFSGLAPMKPSSLFISVERSRHRAQRMVRRSRTQGLSNLVALRGNIIPMLMYGLPDACIDRIFVLYPPPWYKNRQRKKRWYAHPVMRHLHRVLKPHGVIVWTSDQEFYIREAAYVCERSFGMETISSGPLKPHELNEFERFPLGRTKFEETFLNQGIAVFESICRKQDTPRQVH